MVNLRVTLRWIRVLIFELKNIFRHTAIVIIALLISISAFGQTSPANDLCNNSISLEILPTIEKCVVSSNQFATSNGNSNICDAMPAGNEVWYNFVTLGDSTKISVKPSGVSPITDLSVSVYTGNNCKALTLWNCFSASGNGAVTFDYLDA